MIERASVAANLLDAYAPSCLAHTRLVNSHSFAPAGLQTEALEFAPGSLPIELYEAKLRSPLNTSAQVQRNRLLGRLSAAATERATVVAVFAAPGFGKTTLLTQWVESDGRPVAWLSLDERDNDPVVLLTYIAIALAQLGPMDPSVFESLRSSTPAIDAVVVPRLIKAVNEIGTPLILVLDDIQAIREQACLDVLATMVLRLPPWVQIAIAGRTEPALPLPRLRAQGLVVDIEARDLAFEEEEARELLQGIGTEPRPTEIADLVRRTEGWPVGIYLAALSMRAGRIPWASRPIHGDDRYVGDYLRSEFLDHLPARTRTFLTQTAAVREMCGDLCDYILESQGSSRALADLARKNLLVTPQDRRHRWYRYHQLFRELLIAELEREEPGRLRHLQSRAAHWYAKNGEPEVALGYAQAADDPDHAAHLFSTVAIDAYRSGLLSTVLRWLAWFLERDLQKEYPLVALAGAWLMTLTGEAENAGLLASASEERMTDERLPDGVTPGQAWSAQLKALWCRDGVERMNQDADLALSLTPEFSSQRSAALFLAGVAKHLSGDRDAAEDLLADALEIGRRIRATPAVVLAFAERAILAMEDGDRDAAWNSVEEARALIHEQQLEEYPTNALLYAVSAHVMAHRFGPESTGEDLVRTQRLRPQLTYAIPWLSVQARLELARAYLQLADPAGARTVLREAEVIFRHRPNLGILRNQFDSLSTRVREAPSSAPGLSTLTSAELRLLPLLATHLSFPELGTRLFVSRHTVKSQAISIYRKLGVSSRSEAVQKAGDLGLLET